MRGGGGSVGNGLVAGAPTVDLLGRSRPVNGMDRGAYECRGIIYVNPSGSGGGTSWATGYTTLATALALAASGDEIWVKLLGQDEKGRVRLSRKAAMEEREKASSGDAPAAESTDGGNAPAQE